MSKSRVKTGQTPCQLQKSRKSNLFMKKKRMSFTLVLLLLLLTSLAHARSPYAPNSEIYQESDAAPRTSTVSQFERMRLDKLGEQRADTGATHPRVKQTPSCRQVASTTPNYDCITETWKLMCTQGPQYNKTCTMPGGFF